MKQIVVLFIATSISLSYGATVHTASKEIYFRRDYTLLPNHSAFYKVHRRAMNFTAAMSTCKLEGSKLLVPRSKDELEQVFNMVNDSQVNNIWLGIHDVYSEGVFVTVDGDANFYANWIRGTPSDHYGRENCVEARRDAGYNDISCSVGYAFVCKTLTEGLTQNDKCETHDPDYIFNESLGKCYKLHSQPKKWSDAFKICVGEESQLAIINSEAEANFFVEQMKKYPETLNGDYNKKYFFMGFSDLLIKGEFLTVEGQTLYEAGYEKWAGGQPDNYKMLEHCGSITRNGTLNDLHCESRSMFFCERALSENNISVDSRSA